MNAIFAQPNSAHVGVFMLIVLGVVLWLVIVLRARIRVMIAALSWQACMAGLAAAGYFARFDAPWRALPTVGFTVAATVWLARRPWRSAFGQWLAATPLWAWIAVQAFRLPLEAMLYSLYTHGVIGVQMTWRGYNFDVMIGATAPVMAWLVANAVHSKAIRQLAIVWNLAGLILLINIVVIAVLSIPFPFQVFTAEPANRFVAQAPFIWLPTLLIPVALFAHLVSLRLLLRGAPNAFSFIQSQH